MPIVSYAYINFGDASVVGTEKRIFMPQICRPTVEVFIKYFVITLVKIKPKQN